MILQIATRLASSSKFRGYSFVDDMIFTAVARCFTAALPKLDPDKECFSYLTQTIYMCFLGIIHREQKFWSVKRKIYEELTGKECDWKDGHRSEDEQDDEECKPR